MKRRARAQTDWIERRIALSGRRLLDIGSGFGALVNEAHGRGARARGVELDAEAVEHCRKHGLDVLSLGEFGSLAGEISAFRPDIVTMSHVLEHLPAPEHSIRLCGSSHIFIEVPSYSAEIAEMFADQEGHLHFFSPRSLAALLRRMDLEIVSLACYGASLGFYWTRPRSLPKRGLRFITRDAFFRTYSLPNRQGLWIRALVRTRTNPA